jgi:tRNA(adenine34) deaminase
MAEKTTRKPSWVRKVTTVSTHPPEGLFAKDAETIAEAMSRKEVSPKGLGSGIRMIQFFINRAGKALSSMRKNELEKAKELLQAKVREQT